MNTHLKPEHSREGCWCLPVVVLTPRQFAWLKKGQCLPEHYIVQGGSEHYVADPPPLPQPPAVP